MGKLLEKMDEQEQNKKDTSAHKSAAKKIMSSSKKDRQISVKMTSEMFNQFTQINKARGMSNNSTINMIIAEYIRENASWLDQ